MIRWSEPVYWRTEQERFRIYYCFWYDEGFLNAKARIFCHEVSNGGDESRKGEMDIYLHRNRWARLRGLSSAEADRHLQRVGNEGDGDVVRYLLETAGENLEDFVNECGRSAKYVVRPIVL
jgi:hypothetical protein